RRPSAKSENEKRKAPERSLARALYSGSHRRATLPPKKWAVPSPKRGLTSVFGMGTGVTPALWTVGKPPRRPPFPRNVHSRYLSNAHVSTADDRNQMGRADL